MGLNDRRLACQCGQGWGETICFMCVRQNLICTFLLANWMGNVDTPLEGIGMVFAVLELLFLD